MNTAATEQAVRATMLHYAQLGAQLARARAARNGELFADVQCPTCGLFHASEPCHPFMKALRNDP